MKLLTVAKLYLINKLQLSTYTLNAFFKEQFKCFHSNGVIDLLSFCNYFCIP